MIESGKMKLSPRNLFFQTLALYALLWIIPDKKLAILTIALFGGYLWYIHRGVEEVLAILIIAVTPLILGKQFQIDLVSASQLNITYRPFGIGVDVIVGIREVVCVLMGGILLWKQVHEKRGVFPTDGLGWVLAILPVVLLISTLLGSILPGISLAHALFYWEPYLLYQCMRSRKPVLSYSSFLAVAAATLLAEGSIAIMQVVHGGPFGTVIEYFPDFIPLDLASDIGTSVYRFGGTFPYANSLAHYLVFAVLLVFPVLFDPKNPVHEEATTAVFVGMAALILTLSRSAWIACGISVLLFLFVAERIYKTRLVFALKLSRFGKLTLLAVMVAGLMLVLPRLAGTEYSFEEYGSVKTRELLFQAAIGSFRSYPLFGVGLEMWVYAMYLQSRTFSTGMSVFRYFPEPVHNGLAKIVVETGLAGLLAYGAVLVGIASWILRLLRQSQGMLRIYGVGLLAAILGVFLNAQLQPLLLDLPLTILFLILYENEVLRARIAKNSYESIQT